MLRQVTTTQNEQIARQVVDSIRNLTIPLDFVSPMSSQEKASIFFMLGMTELQQQKRKTNQDMHQEFKEDEQIIQLKKVRVLQNVDGNAESFYSFVFNPSENEPSEQFGEFRQILEKPPTLDELGQKERQMILSLNQMIQNNTVSAIQLVSLSKEILSKEILHNMMNRYFGFLNSFTELLKMVVGIEIKKNPQGIILLLKGQLQPLIRQLQKSASQLKVCPNSMLKYLCDLTMKQECFTTYFDTFRFLVRLLNFQLTTTQSPQALDEAQMVLRYFIRLTHPGILEFIKLPEFQQGDWKTKWPVLSEEASNKIKILIEDQDIVHKDACLNFIFYLGTKEIQLFSSAKVIGTLIDQLPNGGPKLESDVHSNLLKIKEKMDQDLQRGVTNLVFLMKTMTKAVTNWENSSLKILVVFVEFTITSNALHTSDLQAASILYVHFIDKFIIKPQESMSATYKQIMNLIFNDNKSPFFVLAPYVLQGVSLSTIILLLNQDGMPLKPLLQREDHRRSIMTVFLKFIKENQKIIKEHGLLDYFFKGLDSVHVKLLLKELLAMNKPQGIFMLIIVKFSRMDSFFEDEVCELLGQSWKDNDNVKDGLKQYFKVVPQAKEKILARLQDPIRSQVLQIIR